MKLFHDDTFEEFFIEASDYINNIKLLNNKEFGKLIVNPQDVIVDTRETIQFTYITGTKGLPKGQGISLHIRFPCGINLDALDPSTKEVFIKVNSPDYMRLDVKLQGAALVRGIFIIIENIGEDIGENEKIDIFFGDKTFGGSGFTAPTMVGKTYIKLLYSSDPYPDYAHEAWSLKNPGTLVLQDQVGKPSYVNIIHNENYILNVKAPSIVGINEKFKLKVSVVDEFSNEAKRYKPQKNFQITCDKQKINAEIINQRDTYFELEMSLSKPETLYLDVLMDGNIKGRSNPIEVVQEKKYDIYFGDMHFHSSFSDGYNGYPKEGYEYARYVSLLDFAANADHSDVLWVNLIEENLNYVDKYKSVVENSINFTKDNEFIAIPAYELGSETREAEKNNGVVEGQNHWNAYFLKEEELEPINWRITPYAPQWYEILKNKEVLLIPHPHKTQTNWNEVFTDISPVGEILSGAGSSEKTLPEAKSDMHGAIQKGLNLGYKLGFIGSSDGHMNQPGRGPVLKGKNFDNKNFKTGYACVIAEKLTRESIFKALKNRKCYATNCHRAIVKYSINSIEMGDIKEADENDIAQRNISFEYYGEDKVKEIHIIRNGEILKTFQGSNIIEKIHFTDNENLNNCFKQSQIDTNEKFVYYYIKVIQENKDATLASPIWFCS